MSIPNTLSDSLTPAEFPGPTDITSVEEFQCVLASTEAAIQSCSTPELIQYEAELHARYRTVCLSGVLQTLRDHLNYDSAQIRQVVQRAWENEDYPDELLCLGLVHTDLGDRLLTEELEYHRLHSGIPVLLTVSLIEDVSQWGLPALEVFDPEYVDSLLDL